MLTTVSLSRRRNSVEYVSPKSIKLIEKETSQFDDSSRVTIQSNSNSRQQSLNTFQEVNAIKGIRKRTESIQSSVFEFLNEETNQFKRKYRVYKFLNKPKTFWAISYHILVFILVFGCLIVTVFSTIEKFASEASKVLLILEKIIIIWFINEFILRLWSSSCKQRYQGLKGKFKYIIVPSHLLDIIVIIFSIVVLTINTRSGSEVFAVSAFRGFHRFFQVFQILTLNSQIQPWKLLLAVIYDQSHQLLIIIYIEFMLVCILAYISYILEKNDNNQFDNIAEAMWWAVSIGISYISTNIHVVNSFLYRS